MNRDGHKNSLLTPTVTKNKCRFFFSLYYGNNTHFALSFWLGRDKHYVSLYALERTRQYPQVVMKNA